MHSIADITSGFDTPPQLISLLPDSSEVGDYHSLPLGMSINPYGLVVPNPKRDAIMTTVTWKVRTDPREKGDDHDHEGIEQQTSLQPSLNDARSISSASAFSPPATPESIPASELISHGKSTSSTTSLTITETLIWTGDTVKVLASDSWVVKANDILNEGTQEASDRVSKMVEEERKKAKRGEVDGDRVSTELAEQPGPCSTCLQKAAHTADMRFMYARLAYIRMRAALFDDAGSLFQKSKLDPRFVVSLFPKYAGRSIPDGQELVIWRGLLHDLNEVRTIEEIGTSRCNADARASMGRQSAYRAHDTHFPKSDSEENGLGNLRSRRCHSL